MQQTIKLLRIEFSNQFNQWTDNSPVLPDVDGYAIYELNTIRTPEELEQEKANGHNYINPYSFTIGQPFKLGATCDMNDKTGHKWYVWGWDGNKEAPSLTPSFLMETDKLKVHLYLTAGKVNLLSDSNVELIT